MPLLPPFPLPPSLASQSRAHQRSEHDTEREDVEGSGGHAECDVWAWVMVVCPIAAVAAVVLAAGLLARLKHRRVKAKHAQHIDANVSEGKSE